MGPQLNISWCGDVDRAAELAAFFAKNIDTAYISHSELQGPRALSPTQWRENLPELLRLEIEPRLRAGANPGGVSKPVLVAQAAGKLAAVSLVTLQADAPVPFGIVEDIVVDPSIRGQGIGNAIIRWTVSEAENRGIHRLFLESGIQNERAHHFFEELGFQTCSIVMMKSF